MARQAGTPIHLFVLVMVGLALHGAGCSSDRAKILPPDDQPPPAGWVYGDPAVYPIPPVPGAAIRDSVSGCAFRFPEGGGELRVTPIRSGPRTAPADGAFEVRYTGSSPVTLSLDHQPEDLDFLLAYVSFEGVVLDCDDPAASGWIPLPVEAAVGDTLVFDLPLGEKASRFAAAPAAAASDRGTRPRPQWTGVSQFKRLRFAAGTNRQQMTALYEQNTRDALAALMNAVPPARRGTVTTRMAGAMAFTVYVDSVGPKAQDARYVPFHDVLGYRPACTFQMNDRTAASVAHEVGHHLHHLLLDQGYNSFALSSRPSGHHVGQPGSKNNLIEDPAYFTEYYLNGTASGANPEHGRWVTNNAGTRMRPETSDIPDLEGFTAAMFASVTRQTARIYNYEEATVDVPVIAQHPDSMFQACYEIFAQGTDDVLEAREKLEGALAAIQEADKLPVMLQALGWTYHGKCRFVDRNNQPLSGVMARPVAQAGGATWRLKPGPAASDPTGEYTLPELFPARNTLRVYKGSDSMDVPVARVIPWSDPTTQEQDLGDIVFDPQTNYLPLLQQRRGIWTKVRLALVNPHGGDPIGSECSVYNIREPIRQPVPIQWNGTRMTYSWRIQDETSSRIDAWVDSASAEFSLDGQKILRIHFRKEHVTTEGGRVVFRSEASLTLKDIPLFAAPSPGVTQFSFLVLAGEAAAHVEDAYEYWESGSTRLESREFHGVLENAWVIQFDTFP